MRTLFVFLLFFEERTGYYEPVKEMSDLLDEYETCELKIGEDLYEIQGLHKGEVRTAAINLVMLQTQ